MTEPVTESNVDLPKTISDLNDNIAKYQDLANGIWGGILKLVITLSSSMLVLSFAFVEKVFDDITSYIAFSWSFFFISIIFGVISLVNDTIEFNNWATKQSAKREQYIRLEAEKKTLPYKPETHSDLTFYNDIRWGAITLNAFFLAITFIALALFDKVLPNWLCIIILIVSIIFVVYMNVYLLNKRKTKTTELNE